MSDWFEQELATLDLQDARRDKRAVKLVESFSKHATGKITRTLAAPAEAHAAYRFLQTELRAEGEGQDPPTVSDRLLNAAIDACVARLAGETVVVAVQDTTEISFKSSPVSENGDFWVHSTLAVSADGVPLGLLDQRCYQRPPGGGERGKRRQRPIEEKESYRWIESLQAINKRVAAPVTVITVADREADIFELFAEPRPEHSHLLIRACRQRRLEPDTDQEDDAAESEPVPEYLWDALQQAPVAAEVGVPLRRSPDRQARIARVQLRYRQVTLRPPRHGIHREMEPCTLQAVLATEVNPPQDEEGICWLLLTTLHVASADEAHQCLYYYTLRWLIERFHYVLKSGCQIEQSQLRTANRLQALLAINCIVAWRLLWITYHAREAGDQPATVAFLDLEWQSAYVALHRQQPPQETPTLREVVRWIAMLGGFMARRADGDPGVKVLWQGMTRLHDIVLGVLIVAPHLLDAANA